jgi:hypothetical protein
MVFGGIFVLVGLLGFISNPIVGPAGMFVTNTVHNIAHILIGAMLLIAGARSASASVGALYTAGAVYLLLAVLGFATIGADSSTMLLGLVHINGPDNWLHLALGLVLIGLAWSGRRSHTAISHPA